MEKMLKLLVLTFTITIIYILLSPVAFAQEAVVTGSVVNVRSGPGVDNLKAGVVTRGYRLEILSETGGWYKVRFAGNRVGWVAKDLVEVETTAGEKVQEWVKVTGSVVNVRSGPTTDFEVVQQVSAGKIFQVIGRRGEWLEVQLDGDRHGWLAGWLTEKALPPEQSTENDSTGEAVDKAPGVVIITGEYVNVRSGPGTDQTIISQVGSFPVEKQVEIAVITGSVVNVRTGPGLTYSRITQVEAGQEYPVLKKENDWLQIQLADNSAGWLAGWLAKTVFKAGLPLETGEAVESGSNDTDSGEKDLGEKEENEENKNRGSNNFIVLSGQIWVHTGPGTDFPKIKSLAEGERVELLASSTDWYEVQLADGTSGWLRRRLLSSRGDSDRSGADNKQGYADSKKSKLDIPAEANRVYDITASVVRDETLVTIQSTSPLQYNVLRLESPRRIVIDLPGQKLSATVAREISMRNDMVKRIRLGQFEADTARVVLDLKGHVKYQIRQDNTKKKILLTISPLNLAGKIVVIDPGHGRSTAWGEPDPGAIGLNGTHERTVVLSIAKKLAAMLERAGADIVLTRQGEANISLPARAEIANNLNADVFVSIHANSSPSRWLKGSATYFHAPSWSDLSEQHSQRRRLAGLIQDELINAAGTDDLGVREENFSVLRNTRVPSVLVETAFISNPEEEMKLRDPDFQTKVARGIARGIERFLLDND